MVRAEVEWRADCRDNVDEMPSRMLHKMAN
jgi:hypothetical protein